jgi:transposase-like protein
MFSIKHLGNERKCEDLIAQTVFGNKISCPVCRSRLLRREKYYWCGSCRKKIRLRSFIRFPRSKLKYKDILILILAWQKNIHPGAIKHLRGISYTTINRWYSRFRTLLPRDSILLNGEIEVDEAFFGRQKYHNQKIVIGGVERITRRLKLQEIPDREQDSLELFLTRNVSTESKLHTDCLAGYYDLFWNGYGHEMHNHSLGHFRGTNNIENVWSVTKRRIRRMYGQIKTNKIEEFIVEWEARHNFPELFQNPLTYLKGVLVPY